MRKRIEASVSDHALVRWLERVHGIDMEAMRRELLSQARPFLEAGCSGFPLDGLWAVGHNGKLITLTPTRCANATSGERYTARASLDRLKEKS